jgi:S-formylglutathione hydrolase
MSLETVSANKCFGGTQYVYAHQSEVTNCRMQFAAYLPPAAANGNCPVLYYLSGLTCSEENVTVKAAAQRHAAEHGLIFVAPDTSPRGEGVADDEAWDLGTGAGFYVNATEAPWSANYQMFDYVAKELPALVSANLPAQDNCSVMGHSMGGHGAMIVSLKNPDRYKSVSVLAPICAPSQTDVGKKVFGAYLGADNEAWKAYDTTELVSEGHTTAPIMIDQGDEDDFFKMGMMKIDALEAACKAGGQQLEVRYQKGYDHSYFFVQSFMPDHIAYHAAALKG